MNSSSHFTCYVILNLNYSCAFAIESALCVLRMVCVGAGCGGHIVGVSSVENWGSMPKKNLVWSGGSKLEKLCGHNGGEICRNRCYKYGYVMKKKYKIGVEWGAYPGRQGMYKNAHSIPVLKWAIYHCSVHIHSIYTPFVALLILIGLAYS